jgi:hypothetical protein
MRDGTVVTLGFRKLQRRRECKGDHRREEAGREVPRDHRELQIFELLRGQECQDSATSGGYHLVSFSNLRVFRS